MPKSRTQVPLPPPATPRLALSIREFCSAFGISEAFFYKLKKQGRGPRVMKLGRRTLIAIEAAAEWRCAQENRHARGPLSCLTSKRKHEV